MEAAEHRVGLFSQLLLDMGSIAVEATLPEICRCVCQAGDTCLAMLSFRAIAFAEAIWASMLLLLAGVDLVSRYWSTFTDWLSQVRDTSSRLLRQVFDGTVHETLHQRHGPTFALQ